MPKGPRKFYFAFEKSGLTRFGGLSLFQAFCRSLQIRRFLQVFVHWPDYDYRGYISTSRRELWWLPAEWVRRDNRNLLLLPAKYPQQDLFAQIQRAATKVRPLI